MEETKDGFVLDCSVTMAWCFADEATLYTDGVRDSLANVRAVVPSLWPLEVANATIVGERRKRLDEARSSGFIALLSGLPIIVDDATATKRLARSSTSPVLTTSLPTTRLTWNWPCVVVYRWPASTAS